MTVFERFEGCILGGAIGDAIGSSHENLAPEEENIFYPFGKPKKEAPIWRITDDTQLTLATLETIVQTSSIDSCSIAKQFLKYYKQKKLRGLGASTLKALRELEVGGHWSLVGRKGEYAAGNGAAMRIAPIAFLGTISNEKIREVCSITHNNDEAYIGARCVVIAIQEILNGNWDGNNNLISRIISQIPDTRVRDRLIEIQDLNQLEVIGKLGSSGYVVDSVPLAIAAANQVLQLGLEEMYQTLISIGGDTDTNCSIAGQIAGTLIGKEGIPENLIDNLQTIRTYTQIDRVILKCQERPNLFSF